MKYPIPYALLTVGALLSSALGRAATLESYFDFTKYGAVAVGSTITSNAHGRVSATVKNGVVLSHGAGLSTASNHAADETGIVLSADALRTLTGDFTLQIWYRTGAEIKPNTMLYGGSTSAIGDNSLEGDQALFVGYDIRAKRAQFVRPVTSGTSRWGVHMAETTVGTGTSADTLYDYVLAYDSGARRFSAYMDGVLVGTMAAGDFSGLPALTGGLAIGGVQNSAFTADKAAAVSIKSFLVYQGALGADQIAKIHAFGAAATLTELQSADVMSATALTSAPVAKESVDRAPSAPRSIAAPKELAADPFVAEPDTSGAESTPLRRHRR